MSRSDDDHLLSIARMGVDAEAFLNTPLGRYLMTKAEAEEKDATAALIDCDPTDWRPNQELRNQIHVVRMFRTWLRESIDCGRQAHDQLKDMEDAERNHG